MKAAIMYPASPVKEKDGCAHHWIIESPRGQSSKGMCRLCGKIKDFDNRGGEFFYYNEATPLIVEQKEPWQEEDEEPEFEVA